MKRGQVWTMAGGPDYAGKPRPMVIIQDDRFDVTESVTICGFTTVDLNTPVSRPVIDASPGSGLRQQSHALVDKVGTVPRRRLGRQIGELDEDAMDRISRAIIIFLGLAPRAS